MSEQVKPRFAKTCSTQHAEAYLRLGWIVRHEFRDKPDEQPYEYLLEWTGQGEPPRPDWPPKNQPTS